MNEPKRVVFVRVENSNRSQMAQAFARIHGDERIEAYSAGSRPSGSINPRAIEAMKEFGYDLTQQQSKSLADLPHREFDLAVTMGCGGRPARGLADPRSEEHASGRVSAGAGHD